SLRCDDRSLAVQRIADRVDHASDHRLPDRDGDDLTGAADRGPFPNLFIWPKDYSSYVVLFEVQGHGADNVLIMIRKGIALIVQKLQHLSDHAVLQAVHAGDSITDLQHGTDPDLIEASFEPCQLS